jgi:hypothetical protein
MDFKLPQQETHVMVHEGTLESGEDQFYCPFCGRRVLYQWPPKYKKTVLVAGNVNAIHNAGKGGLQIGTATVSQQHVLSEEDHQRLVQWETWLDKLDYSGLPGLTD